MSQESFVPVNQLEESLQRAAKDPGARPDFYRKLLENDIFLLTPIPPERQGKQVIETDTVISFVRWQGQNGHFIPAFTSRERLQEAVNQSGITFGYLALNAKKAFEILTQNPVSMMLNPGCSYGKEFLTNEMKELADGSFFKSAQEVVQKARQVFLGQPKEYPHELVKVLSSLFQRHSPVIAAYLAQMHDPESSDPPHLLIGIECPGLMAAVVPDAGVAAREILGANKFVDFVEVGSGKGSFDNYFKKQTKPFYQRAADKPGWKFWK